MNVAPFFSYFLKYIFYAKTRQKLLFIAVGGLFLSTFSLVVIQGIMGGLQQGLISRSKGVNGSFVIRFQEPTNENLSVLKELLKKEALPFYSELETEVMLKHKNFVAPGRLHGVDLGDETPDFLQDRDFSGLVFGADLASKLKLQYLGEVQVIAPGVTDSFMGEVPRFVSEGMSDHVYTEVTEVDEFEVWSRVELVQNLLRTRGINQIRVFGELSSELRSKLTNLRPQTPFEIITWEHMNNALVWSLNLETKVMLFLFTSMSFLVAIAITSGLLIFFSKIKKDLMSFWILGMPQKLLMQLCFKFTLIFSGLSCLVGGLCGYGVLTLLESHGHTLMPDIFVERSISVQLNFSNMLLSFMIPFSISVIFSYFSFAYFRKENQSFVAVVRSLS